MYINPYNIEKGLCELLDANKDKIQEIINAFYGSKTKKTLHIFKSVMPSLQQQYFPCLEMDKLILKFIWKCKGPKVGKIILKKKIRFGGLTLLHFKLTTKIE